MLGLRALVGQLNEQVESARRKYETEQRRARAAVAKGGWGTAGAGAEGQGPLVEAGVVEDLRRRVGELALAHNKAVGEFTERLPEEVRGRGGAERGGVDGGARGDGRGVTAERESQSVGCWAAGRGYGGRRPWWQLRGVSRLVAQPSTRTGARRRVFAVGSRSWHPPTHCVMLPASRSSPEPLGRFPKAALPAHPSSLSSPFRQTMTCYVLPLQCCLSASSFPIHPRFRLITHTLDPRFTSIPPHPQAQDDVRFLLARLDFSARPGTTRDGAFATAD